MSLELGGQAIALVSLLITAPLALRSRATEAVHARLIGVAMFAGYCTLASIHTGYHGWMHIVGRD